MEQCYTCRWMKINNDKGYCLYYPPLPSIAWEGSKHKYTINLPIVEYSDKCSKYERDAMAKTI